MCNMEDKMIDLTKEYGVFKTLCSNNCYNSLAKTLSSELSTRATLPTIKRLTNNNMKYGHMGQLVIKNDEEVNGRLAELFS